MIGLRTLPDQIAGIVSLPQLVADFVFAFFRDQAPRRTKLACARNSGVHFLAPQGRSAVISTRADNGPGYADTLALEKSGRRLALRFWCAAC